MKYLTAVFLLLPISAILGQDLPIIHDTLYSMILKEKRPLEIIFPKDDSLHQFKNYEVIYAVDGTSNFMRLEWNFLQGEGFIPKNMILVGVEDTYQGEMNLRDRDFSPTIVYPNSGGAEKFLSFFKTELIPYMTTKYHAKSSGNTLYGGSLGGLFVVYAFLQQKDLFTSYIAVDPSLWWDNFYLNKRAENQTDQLGGAQHSLWIVGRTGSPYHFMGTAGIDSVLQKKADPQLKWTVSLYDNETHYSTNFKGFYEGLKFSYGGFYASTGGYNISRDLFIKPMNGIAVKNRPFPLFCYNLAAEHYIHYSTNGQLPTDDAPLLKGDETPIVLVDNTSLIVSARGARPEYDKSDTAHFQVSEALQPELLPKGIRRGGLHYLLYDDNLHAKREGFADSAFDINKVLTGGNRRCLLEGYIRIDQAGYYIFEMGDGNEKTQMEISNIPVLGIHYKKEKGESFLVPLLTGFYSIKISYSRKKGDGDLEPVYVKPEYTGDMPLPQNSLYSGN